MWLTFQKNVIPTGQLTMESNTIRQIRCLFILYPVSKPHEKTVIRSLPIGHRKKEKMEGFAVWVYNDLRFSEPLLRLLPRRGQAFQNSQVWSEVPPRHCLGRFYQHCLGSLWTDCLLRLLPPLDRISHIVTVLWEVQCSRCFCLVLHWSVCASHFQVLERDLTIAPRLRNKDKIELSLT